MTAITDQASSFGGATSLDGQSYGYNASSNVTSETNAEGAVSYTYDAINELTGVTGASSAAYSYDANGNRTMSGYSTGPGNETTSGAGYTYTYDQDGNLTAKTQTSTGNVWSYTWDYRNRLTNVVEVSSSHTVLMRSTYTYDAMNRRIGVDETLSGVETKTYTIYDGVNPYADFDGSGNLLEHYLYGPGANQILARTSSSGTIDWYVTDHLGSVHDVVNTSGSVIDHLGYDAYGNVTTESSASNGDRFKFDAMAWDTAIGLFYDNARYYNPRIGNFISSDPIGFKSKVTNLYDFCGDQPTNIVDPTGNAGDHYWDLNIGIPVIPLSPICIGVGFQSSTYANGDLSMAPYITLQTPGVSIGSAPGQTATPGVGVGVGAAILGGLGHQGGFGGLASPVPDTPVAPYNENYVGTPGAAVSVFFVAPPIYASTALSNANPFNSVYNADWWYRNFGGWL